MNLVKEKQGGLVPTGLKRWPFKLIKHFADATGVSPSPAGPAGCCPLNFLNLINLKFRVRAPNGRSAASDLVLHCLLTSHKRDARLKWVKTASKILFVYKLCLFRIWNFE